MTFDDPLARVSNARSLLQQAASVDEIERLVADQQEQLYLYRREDEDTDAINRLSAEIRLRGLRRIGEILASVQRNVTGRPEKSDAARDTSPTPLQQAIGDAGLTDSQARRAQKLATVPDEEFEGKLDEWREGGVTPSERAFLNSMSSPTLSVSERYYHNVWRWSGFTTKCQPDEFADIALEKPSSAESIANEFREIAAFMTRAADLIDQRLQQPMVVLEGGKMARGA